MGKDFGKFGAVGKHRHLVENPADGCFGLGAGGSESAQVVKIAGLRPVQGGVGFVDSMPLNNSAKISIMIVFVRFHSIRSPFSITKLLMTSQWPASTPR